jgi:acetyl-CoA carboxylase biotin carboxylase subunit
MPFKLLKMKKILVANRGEIAVRVLRSAKEMGIKTIAVFSEADRHSPHVLMADEAVCIGPPPSSESYLLGEKIIEFALKLNADGIHPGYGFLSENHVFAESVKQAGIKFIGPSPSSIETMGNKLMAKKTVTDYGIPMVPGTEEALKNIDEALDIAKSIGFPLLIKAAAGGGGKGMRVVHEKESLKNELDRAINEARSAFGDSSVFIEKYIENPRHIEVQVLADMHGKVIHLFERECSIQRRHQKLIEEAPSVIIDDNLRNKLGECAVNVAKACNYTGAGTVEFIMDEDKSFYFLEMNTRLQVEHPVTEMITGIDLVKEQIKIADGLKLGFDQADLNINGHAIELRVCAEDSLNNFLPETGTLDLYKTPQGPGVRVDDGLYEGMEIPIYYDPMIAKLIVHSSDRKSAINKMKRAITEYHINGVSTTLDFGHFVMENKAFIDGDFNTHFIEKHFKPEMLLNNINEDEALVAGFAAVVLHNKTNNSNYTIRKKTPQNAWFKNRKS